MRVACCSIALGLLACGCSSSSQVQLPPPQPIICTAGADCDGKWSRAQAWLAKNSPRKIEAHTDTVLETTQSLLSESAPVFTVTKVARGQGRYEITFNGGCGSQSRCVPTVPESRARFTAFVLGEEPPPQSQ